MKYIRSSLAIILALGGIGNAMAAATADEARQLGTTLTAMGAEKAASKDSSIPEFTNTPITPPADYKPGSGRYPDPFKNEKPLFSIDAKNLDQYADKLSEGSKALLKRWPSYRVDVYPTHRTATYSKWIGENTLRNATSAKLVAESSGVEGAYGGPPFPIPKSGLEVIWNSFLQPTSVAADSSGSVYSVDSSGQHLTNGGPMYQEYPYYDPDRTSLDGWSYYKYLVTTTVPMRDAGNKVLAWYSINYAKQDDLLWIYSTGQRRVRLAPETKYDSIAGAQGYIFDETNLFTGNPDRYDFKLVGKKEIYVPYNAYRAAFGSTDAVLLPQHFNPDALRWELHRVWVVDGTLKPGMKHKYARRTFYADEDSWALLLSDSYDTTGKLSRIGQSLPFAMYEVGNSGINANPNVYYSVFKEGYTLHNNFSDLTSFVVPVPKHPASETSPDTMGGSGIR